MRPRTSSFVFSLLFAACDGTPEVLAPTIEPGPPLLAVSGATFQGGADHFYFLPPIARPLNYDGEFVGAWGTRVAVCEWNSGACVGAPVAVFEGDAVTVQDRQERYWAHWKTEASGLVVGRTYRIGVEVTSASPVPQPMGFADVVTIQKKKDEDAVRAAGSVPLAPGETLPVRFRIEDGAVDTEGPVASGLQMDPDPGFVGEPLPLTATLADAFGSDVAGADVSIDGGATWHPMEPADRAFDSAVESVLADGPLIQEAGERSICVRGRDQWGLVGAASCATFAFVIPCVSQDMGSGGAGFDLTLAKVLVGLQQGHGDEEDPGQPDRHDGMSWVYHDNGTRNADVSNCWSQWDRVDIVTPGGWNGLDADTEAFVGRNWETGDLVVSFRGTEPEAADVFTDLNAIPMSWSGKPGLYHLGFVNAYLSVREQLVRVLTAEAARTDLRGRAPISGRVFFIGHSLGGALATLAALDLSDLVDDAVMYSFAAPRSMTHEAAQAYGSRVGTAWAVAHQEDPVPSLPGPAILWSHIPNMVVVNSMQLLGETPTHPARIDVWDGSQLRPCDRPGGIATHFLDRYFARLFGVRATAPRRGYLETSWLGTMIVRWDTGDEIVPGPCDWVAIFPGEDAPTNPVLHLPGSRRGVINPALDEFPAVPYPMVPNLWAGYVDGRGVIVAKEKYEVPTVQLQFNGAWVCPTLLFCSADDKSPPWTWISSGTVSFQWWLPSDVGPTDFVALFTQDPATAGASGYEWATRTPAIAWPFHRLFFVPEDRYWVAYISQEGTDASTRTILAKAGPVCRDPRDCPTSR